MVRSKVIAVGKALAGVAMMAAAGAAQAATPVYTGSGNTLSLTGATGVDVAGTLYNVEFLDGNCNTLFASCTSAGFAFTDQATATAAAGALLDQVLISFAGLANFDASPALTRGCEDASVCNLYIPYAVANRSANVAIASNLGGAAADLTTLGTIAVSTNTNTDAKVAFARFTPGAVPEPSTWLLMMAGFAVAGFALRRRTGSERRAVFA